MNQGIQSRYVFSIVMAVYNVEPFLREAIDSVIAQDLGFDKIQLILVDDGSPDGSGRICDEYGAKYDNIHVIHKKNGGVAAARNTGLDAVCGRYVNFLDSDDKLTSDCCSRVYRFIQEHGDEVDVISIPMIFFDGHTGGHVLNDKHALGMRVIDLEEECSAIQLSASSAFISMNAIEKLGARMNVGQKYAEDATFLQPILWQKMKLGVVDQCSYLYRRRTTGAASAIQASTSRKEWWLDYLYQFPHSTIERAKAELGRIPRFVQYVIAYDLQWRIREDSIPQGILTQEETGEYWRELRWILKHLDDDILLSQKYIWKEHKVFMLKEKHGGTSRVSMSKDDVVFGFSESAQIRMSECSLYLEFMELTEKECTIEGYFSGLPIEGKQLMPHIEVNGKPCKTENFERAKANRALGEEICSFIGFKTRIPLNKKDGGVRIAFCLKIDQTTVHYRTIHAKQFFPVGTVIPNAYYTKAGWIAQFSGSELVIKPYQAFSHFLHEIRFMRELWRQDGEGNRKAILVRAARHVLKQLNRKRIWLISDRIMKADDNGEAFFEFMNKLGDKQIRHYFVISKESEDYERLRRTGRVVDHYSIQHKLLHLLSERNISSAGEMGVINPFAGHHESYRDIMWETKYVFLQHGIIMNDLSGWLNRYAKSISGFITAARPEYQSIIQGNYGYTGKQVWLTGLARHDRLYHQEENLITIMPTWRKYLMDSFDPQKGIWQIPDAFVQSEYYCFYNGLLNHPRLLAAMKEYGYRMLFMPHPNLMPHIDVFQRNDYVEFCSPKMTYRDVFARSRLMVSDYSSAVLDFSYLRKPVIYAHFDVDTFFSGSHMCDRGYFDHVRDGFGEVTYDLDETVNQIIEYIESDCTLKEEFRERIDRFFAFEDQNNRQRIYEKILSMD